MNLPETLKHFKTITADPAYQEKSKRAILAQTPRERLSVWRVFIRVIETGFAVALTGFLILIIVGKFPGSQYISPVQPSLIDPQGLHAEAEAVDMQIQLANLTYMEPTATIETAAPQSTAAPAAARALSVFSAVLTATSSTSSSTTPAVATTGTSSVTVATSSASVTIDEALQALSN